VRGKLTRAYRRGWNEALQMLLFVLEDEYGDEEPLTKRSIAQSCRRIRFRPYQVRAKTNQELAAFYGCSRRTIQYWRSKGAPLERGGDAMLRWVEERP